MKQFRIIVTEIDGGCAGHEGSAIISEEMMHTVLNGSGLTAQHVLRSCLEGGGAGKEIRTGAISSREYLAGLAMQALIQSDKEYSWNYAESQKEGICKEAVEHADAMIAALRK